MTKIERGNSKKASRTARHVVRHNHFRSTTKKEPLSYTSVNYEHLAHGYTGNEFAPKRFSLLTRRIVL